mgnify:CR=1 FL=1|tara:strand:- start:260 stop:1045 length:786 start_codon:yes stop_codon:yes gene_type:complete
MKKYFLLLLGVFVTVNVINSQENTESLEVIDSAYLEQYRNYFGSNITPLLSGVVSGKDNFNVKVNLSYKRNFGEKNLRFSMNYLTEGNVFPYDYYSIQSTTDTTLHNRYFDNSYEHYDFRFGFEELRGYGGARVHVGVDAIIGFGNNSSIYFDRTYLKDTTGAYILTNDVSSNNFQYSINGGPVYNGYHFIDYLITGIDVSFGFDWLLNDRFMFTFQVVPQFNYYIFLNEKFGDQHMEYQSATNYADFKLGYFDLMLYYRF